MAYAAVISLKHTIQLFTNLTNPQITKLAYDELMFLEDVLTRLPHSTSRKIDMGVTNSLDAEIRESVCKLEDVLDSYVLHRSLPPPQGFSDNLLPSVDEKGVEQEIDSFLKTVKRLAEEYIIEVNKPSLADEDEDEDDEVWATEDFGGKRSTMVGMSDQLDAIMIDLLYSESRSKIISLVGMAGIGKTHLAREIYQHQKVVQHFDFIAWVSVGQKRQMKNVVVDIVAQKESKPRNVYVKQDMSSLLYLLDSSLNGLRYLIVLDDVWSREIHITLLWRFPNGSEGSRICLTTRLQEVACNTSIHNVRFLNNEESWDLLWMNVFEEKSFPPQLEKAGREIAENCEGLPLLILEVADILSLLDKTEDYWKKVAQKKTTIFIEAYDKILEVLYSSYEYLQVHLRACFLYMGVFPQSCEIPLPKLIHLWTVEDFLEPNQSQNLEDFALECLEKLVSNSLAILCKWSFDDRIKSCKLHSAYWHLCVKEARKIKFLHVLKKLTDSSADYVESQRRLSIQNNILFGLQEVYNSMTSASTTRSLLFTGEYQQFPVPLCFNLLFLKVMDALAIRLYEFPIEVIKLFKLRYLTLNYNGKLPSSISKLQLLQYLIVRQHHNIVLVRDSSHFNKRKSYIKKVLSNKLPKDPICLPREIWDMQELKHLRIMGSNLPDPIEGRKLSKLLTLYVNAHSCTQGVLRSIPNLEKLGIKIEVQPDAAETFSCFKHVGLLHNLKSLKCVVANPPLSPRVAVPFINFQHLVLNLRKVSLNGLGYPWENMKAFASLLNLEVLKLRCAAFQGPVWESETGKFRRLKFLLLDDIDLVHWHANRDYFPNLQRLRIRHCYKLKKIPHEIGVIPTLEMMEIVDCSSSVVASAQEIQETRNSSLQVVITSSWSL